MKQMSFLGKCTTFYTILLKSIHHKINSIEATDTLTFLTVTSFQGIAHNFIYHAFTESKYINMHYCWKSGLTASAWDLCHLNVAAWKNDR